MAREGNNGPLLAAIQLNVASGGKVGHLESRLQLRFAPRSSGQITSAFSTGVIEGVLLKPVC